MGLALPYRNHCDVIKSERYLRLRGHSSGLRRLLKFENTDNYRLERLRHYGISPSANVTYTSTLTTRTGLYRDTVQASKFAVCQILYVTLVMVQNSKINVINNTEPVTRYPPQHSAITRYAYRPKFNNQYTRIVCVRVRRLNNVFPPKCEPAESKKKSKRAQSPISSRRVFTPLGLDQRPARTTLTYHEVSRHGQCKEDRNNF